MTQYAWPPLDPVVDDGITLSASLNLAMSALYSTHAGVAAPPDPLLGQPWLDTSLASSTPPSLAMKFYDGSTWRPAWTVNTATGAFTFAGTLPDAPIDGTTYGRRAGAWAGVLPLAGGTLTGNLVLPINDGVLGFGSGAGSAYLTRNSLGDFVLQFRAPDASMVWGSATGTLVWYQNAVGAMTLDWAGHLWVKGNVTSGNGAFIMPGGTSLIRDGAGRVFLNCNADWRMYWESSNGDWSWQGNPGFTSTKMTLSGAGSLAVAGLVSAPLGIVTQGLRMLWSVDYPGTFARLATYLDTVFRGYTVIGQNVITLAIGSGYLNIVGNDASIWSTAIAPSDPKLKDNIEPAALSPDECLAQIVAIELVQFDWKPDVQAFMGDDHVAVGVTTTQLKTIDPELVSTPPQEGAPENIAAQALSVRMVGAVQALAARLVALEGAR